MLLELLVGTVVEHVHLQLKDIVVDLAGIQYLESAFNKLVKDLELQHLLEAGPEVGWPGLEEALGVEGDAFAQLQAQGLPVAPNETHEGTQERLGHAVPQHQARVAQAALQGGHNFTGY